MGNARGRASFLGLFPVDESTVAVAELNPSSCHRGELAREGMRLIAPHHPGSLHGDATKNLKTLSFCIATQPQRRVGTAEGRRGERQHQEKQQQVEKKKLQERLRCRRLGADL